jgi:hypothetical protein
MTPTDLSTALTEVRDAVEAPPADRLAFHARVRAERRRRTAGRAAIALAGAAAAASVVGGVLQVLPEEEGTPVATTPPREVADPTRVVGFVVQDRLVVGGPGGFTATDVPARNVLGVFDGQLLLADTTGALVSVSVDEDGVPGASQRLGTVLRAYADGADRVVVEETEGVYRAWRPGTEGLTVMDLDLGDDVATAFDGDRRVDSGPDGYTLVGVDGPVRELPAGGGIIDQDLVAGVLALETLRGARFFDADTGEVLARVRGEGYTGGLSPDAATYARSTEDGVVLVDPRTGRRTPVEMAVDVRAGGIAWTGADTFVAAGRDDDTGTGVLQECDAVARTCRLLYEDPSGTLKLSS